MHKKFKMGKKILAVLLSAVVTASVLPADFVVRMGQQAKAAETDAGIKDNDGYPLVYNRKGDDYIKAVGTPEQGQASRNIHKENYRNVSLPVTSYLYSEKNGSITRVDKWIREFLLKIMIRRIFHCYPKKHWVWSFRYLAVFMQERIIIILYLVRKIWKKAMRPKFTG